MGKSLLVRRHVSQSRTRKYVIKQAPDFYDNKRYKMASGKLMDLCVMCIADGFSFYEPQISSLPRHMKGYLMPVLCKRSLITDENIGVVGIEF